mmetsp:Transcript_27221/g.74539  ORF Transcript_27221/g.74539 Transcript_27221/m.74539 type:complete len:147 (+) Transcript_27221:3896-4336(+)
MNAIKTSSSLISGSFMESFLLLLLTPFETPPVLVEELDVLFDRRFEFDLPLPPRLPPLPRPRPPELFPPLDDFFPPVDPAEDDIFRLLMDSKKANPAYRHENGTYFSGTRNGRQNVPIGRYCRCARNAHLSCCSSDIRRNRNKTVP